MSASSLSDTSALLLTLPILKPLNTVIKNVKKHNTDTESDMTLSGAPFEIPSAFPDVEIKCAPKHLQYYWNNANVK